MTDINGSREDPVKPPHGPGPNARPGHGTPSPGVISVPPPGPAGTEASPSRVLPPDASPESRRAAARVLAERLTAPLEDAARPLHAPSQDAPMADGTALFRSRPADSQIRLRRSLAAAADVDPDRYARVLAMAKRTGLPSRAVALELEKIERKVQIQDNMVLLRDAPVTAQAMQESEFANLALRDIKNMTYFERLWGATKQSFSIGRDSVTLGQIGFDQIMGRATPEQLAEATRIETKARREFGIDGFFEGIIPATAEALPMTYQSFKGGMDESVAGATIGAGVMLFAGNAGPQALVPEEVVTVPIGAVGGAIIGHRIGSAFETATLEAGLAYREYIKIVDENGNKIDESVAKAAALTVGAIGGALESVGLDKILKSIPGGKKVLTQLTRGGMKNLLKVPSVRKALVEFVGNTLKSATEEGIAEFLQESVTMLAAEFAKILSQGEFEHITAEEFLTRALKAAIQGFQGGLGLGAPGATVTLGRDAVRTRTAKRTRHLVKAMGESARTSNVRALMPSKYRQYTKAVKAQGVTDHVYVDAEALAAYFQSDGVPADWFEFMPELPRELSEAAATDRPVAIPFEDYQTYVAPTDAHDSLAKDIKFRPDDMTLREAERFESDALAMMQAEYEEALKRDPKEPDLNDPAEFAYETVRAQLVEAGMTPDQAATQAALHRVATRVMMERYGASATEVLRRYGGLQITGALPETLRPENIGDVDLLLERARRGVRTGDRAQFGESLDEFVRRLGIMDDQDDLAAKGIDKDLKPFQRKALRDTGMSVDALARAAFEAGYFPELNAPPDSRTFLQALDDAGDLFAGEPTGADASQRIQAAEDLIGTLGRLGIGLDEDNAVIKAALANAAHEPDGAAQTLGQAAKGKNRQAVKDITQAAKIKRKINKKIKDHMNKSEGDKEIVPTGPWGRTKLFDNDLSKWKAKIESYFKGGRFPDEGLLVGDLNIVLLEMLGSANAQNERPDSFGKQTKKISNEEVYLERQVIEKVRQKHPDVPKEVLENLPELIQNPAYAYPHREGGLVFLIDAKSTHGDPLVVGIRGGYVRTITPFHPGGGRTGYERMMDTIAMAAEKNQSGKSRAKNKIYVRDKEARDELNRYIESIRRDKKREGKRPDQLARPNITFRDKVFRAHGYLFYQDMPETMSTVNGERGAIQFLPDEKTVIHLFENADLSTFAHESGHLFVRAVEEMATVSEEARVDLSAMMAFTGVATVEDFRTNIEAQEKLARAFEAYLREGEAPSPELRAVFQRMREWLVQLYRSLRELDVELNDDIRAVFDRMLATDDEIAAAKRPSTTDIRDSDSTGNHRRHAQDNGPRPSHLP